MKLFVRPIILLSMVLITSCSEVKKTVEVVSPVAQVPQPIAVKVVVVNMFEIGEDEGDRPGEFQLWKAGQALNTKFEFPQGFHDLYFNEKTGVLGMVTGMGTARAATAVMALGLDPRFDLSQSYWLVAGIAGVDPKDASIGSAVWATWLIDGDLAHQIDPREAPEDWATGYYPLFSTAPYNDKTLKDTSHQPSGEVYKINAKLAEWAFQLTKDTKLNDYPAMAELRSAYVNYPNAQRPPFVLKGDHMASSTFWHGKLLNDWANSWSDFWSDNQANFVTSGMEDTGSYQAMTYLNNIGKVDKNRFMVLRTGSNYTHPPEGITPADNLAMESGEEGFAGMQGSLDSAYRVGSMVVDDIVENWDAYKNTLPYEVK